MPTAKPKGAELFNETELAIIRYICKEYKNAEMAKKMKLSQRTIEGYRADIMQKMKAKTMAGLVIFAIKWGIFTVK